MALGNLQLSDKVREPFPIDITRPVLTAILNFYTIKTALKKQGTADTNDSVFPVNIRLKMFCSKLQRKPSVNFKAQ